MVAAMSVKSRPHSICAIPTDPAAVSVAMTLVITRLPISLLSHVKDFTCLFAFMGVGAIFIYAQMVKQFGNLKAGAADSYSKLHFLKWWLVCN
ncbi:hypothetical protein Hdeb2414_s0015g00440391 [Helianthus debilis subsp. tardiflorus]